jgi:glutathione S-transferase
MLWEARIAHTLVEAPVLDSQYEIDRQVAYRDNDDQHTEVIMSPPILVYLDKYFPLENSRPVTANVYPVILLASGLVKAWYNHSVPTYGVDFANLLALLEDRLDMEEGPFMAGRRFSIADCYVWPVMDEVIEKWGGWSEEKYPCLGEWYRNTWRKKACVKKLRAKLPEIKKLEANGNGKKEE